MLLEEVPREKSCYDIALCATMKLIYETQIPYQEFTKTCQRHRLIFQILLIKDMIFFSSVVSWAR